MLIDYNDNPWLLIYFMMDVGAQMAVFCLCIIAWYTLCRIMI